MLFFITEDNILLLYHFVVQLIPLSFLETSTSGSVSYFRRNFLVRIVYVRL